MAMKADETSCKLMILAVSAKDFFILKGKILTLHVEAMSAIKIIFVISAESGKMVIIKPLINTTLIYLLGLSTRNSKTFRKLGLPHVFQGSLRDPYRVHLYVMFLISAVPS